MPKSRAVLAATTVTLAALAGTLASASSATAATSLCGSTYNYVGKHPMKRTSGTGGPRTGGYVYVYYSARTKHNCAISKPVAQLRGKARGLGVGLYSPRYNRGHSDGYQPRQNYTQWAGPVYVKAPQACINVVGDMTTSRAHYAVTKRGVHCG
ncbi:hypothetical protein AB0B04_32120 [Streptomyces xinghaiensis]|uniref:Spore-associated protein A n=2 Tax=Streptomyces TaxID=1883 RepID=A0A3R7LIV7_9ACTN|nr:MULTISPECIES: hypothetical protein [Streptomyces]KNE80126.1 hypothetical protein ADZ36_23575 [Streptomyces fradiae]OFA50959.1 hypothetical protein BEN35_15130 [Streptomyces fradiae]PQM19545.1 hypothetical protein Sfr7A_31745 [Streptomyces xinghaiensis]RKM90969.1 hypothetical protein SFRA_030540 [Streptomyces xinghaiensis]RNC68970.1 hypothetical protein DC095_030785 [Streptomyces xinghaiensis]